MPAVALMGTTLYESQQRALLRHFRSLILMLDGDATGRCATATIAAQLRPHIPLRVIHLPDQVQPDQPTTDAVGELFPQRQAAPGPIC